MHNGRNRLRLEKDDGAGGYYGYFEYENLIEDILSETQQSIELALDAGVQPQNIIIDPGIGFGKTAPQNLELLNKLSVFQTLGYPILLGTSAGVDIVRVHDVQAVARAVRMTDVIVRSNFT